MKKTLIILIALGGITCLQADPLYWPASPRPPAKSREAWVKCEGKSMHNLRLTINETVMDLTFLGHFSIAEGDSRWNATLVIPEQPSIRCGITVFEPGTWMQDLSDEAFKSYLLGLQDRGASEILSTLDQSFLDDVMILNYQPMAVEYTLGDTRCREYFVEVGGRMIVFTYEAPRRFFEVEKDNARLLFARTILL